jgi:hypothetical protein
LRAEQKAGVLWRDDAGGVGKKKAGESGYGCKGHRQHDLDTPRAD